jgi:hypothetical protein
MHEMNCELLRNWGGGENMVHTLYENREGTEDIRDKEEQA